jgi:hypothetical protein
MFRYIAVILLTAVVAILAAKTWIWTMDPEVQIKAAVDPDCDLRAGPCTGRLPDGRSIRFSIEPRSIPPLMPLRLKVDTIGFAAREVSVDLNGVGMHMGFNRVALNEHPQGYFTATGSLSVCIRDTMAWEAVVSLISDDRRISAPFRFITTKHPIRP